MLVWLDNELMTVIDPDAPTVMVDDIDGDGDGYRLEIKVSVEDGYTLNNRDCDDLKQEQSRKSMSQIDEQGELKFLFGIWTMMVMVTIKIMIFTQIPMDAPEYCVTEKVTTWYRDADNDEDPSLHR